MKSSIVSLQTDVLVIGAGAAGLRAALAAQAAGASVILAAKGRAGAGGATFLAGAPNRGVQGDPDADDASIEGHAREILDAGLGAGREDLARILAAEAPARARELLEWGLVPILQGGRPALKPGCFSRVPRALVFPDFAAFGRTALARLDPARVRILDHTLVTRLIVAEGSRGGRRCAGAWTLDRAGREGRIDAGAVVLATGGGGGAFSRAIMPADQIGQGTLLALEAGVAPVNLEFVQIMIGTTRPRPGRHWPAPLLSKLAAVEGRSGRDLLPGWFPDPAARAEGLAARAGHFPFSTRDAGRWLDIGLARALRAGEGLASGGLRFRLEGLPAPHAEWADAEVAPHAHAGNGGIPIGPDGDTALPGLYACGEAAGGVHGADRPGGNSIAACLVFGKRAGEAAVREANGSEQKRTEAGAEAGSLFALRPSPFGVEAPPLREDLAGIARALRHRLTEEALVLRNPERLRRAAAEAAAVRDALDAARPRETSDRRRYWETRSLAAFAAVLMGRMAERSQSLGPHFVEGRVER